MSYSWYRTGTCTTTSGSARVNFQNANITTAATKPVVGDAFTIDNSDLYEVIFIGSDATGEYVMLDRNFEQASASNAKYAFMRLASSTQNAKLVAQAAEAINQKQISLEDMHEWYTLQSDEVEFTQVDGTIVKIPTWYKFSNDLGAVGPHLPDIETVADNIDTVKAAPAAAQTATEKAAIATTKAAEADASEKAAAISAGNAAASTILISEQEARAIQWQNENANFDASGMVNAGKTYPPSGSFSKVNEGLWTRSSPNILQIGRASSQAGVGASKTDFGVIHIAGAVINLTGKVDTVDLSALQFQLPPSEDGTRTYNKATGESITHPDVATAFALAATSDDIEVVTHRVDLVGLEYYEEELTGTQEVFECIQSLSTTFGDTDVPTVLSTRKLSYFQQYDGQFPEVKADPDKINDRYRCVVWSNLTDEQKRKVAACMGEKLFMGVNGNIVNGRLRARTVRGAGNGDWSTIDSTLSGGNYALAYSDKAFINAQGNKDVGVGVSSGWTSDTYLTPKSGSQNNKEASKGTFSPRTNSNLAYKDRCFMYVVATVPRANKGAYHPDLNPWGTARWEDYLTQTHEWWFFGNAQTFTKQLAFTPVGASVPFGKDENPTTGAIGGTSGHPDGILYDGIYAGGLNGIIDWRLPAIANDSPEEAAKVEAKVENGTYRGLEKLVWARATQGDPLGRDGKTFGIYTAVDRVQIYGKDSTGRHYQDFMEVGDAISFYNADLGEVYAGKVTAVLSDAVWVKNPKSDMNWNFGSASSSASVIYVIAEEKTNLSVSDELNTQMVIGDPANILKTDALKNGWLGTWCPVIPDGVSRDYPLTKKSKVTSGSRQWTADDGVTWQSGPVSLGGVENSINTGVGSEVVTLVQYKAFANQTKPSTAKPVLNATKGLLGVTVTQSHDKSVLAEAVAGIILKSDASGIVTEQSQAVKYLVDGTIKRLKTLPTDMVAPTNSSQAIKIAVYQISNNGQTSLAIIANTMTHNGTGWGELDEIYIPSSGSESFTDTNGTTQQAICTELSMASGWTSNHARTGPQVAGVDL
ncbi:hypothetical protein VPHD60_0010 [Vibrio phage D60]